MAVIPGRPSISGVPEIVFQTAWPGPESIFADVAEHFSGDPF
jgi:hypothetical protein